MAYGFMTHSYVRSTEKRRMDQERARATEEYKQGEHQVIEVPLLCTCSQRRYPHKWHDWETDEQVATVYRAIPEDAEFSPITNKEMSDMENEANEVSTPQLVEIFFDGACEPRNPGGAMGLGWVINGEVGSDYVPAAPTNSNNMAEYSALIAALNDAEADRMPDDILVIHGDSRLVLDQLAGKMAVHAPHLVPLYEQAMEKINRYCHVKYEWIPREANTTADAASKAALVAHGVHPVDRSKWKKKPSGTAARSTASLTPQTAGRK